jgi:long-chain acyl-CoA synthetase
VIKGLRTLNDIFFTVVDRDEPRLVLHRKNDAWTAVSSADFYRNVISVAGALTRWGIGKGDRVAILSENRPEWTMADFATVFLGAVTVPIYSTLTAEQTAYVLGDSGARVIFVSTKPQLDKVLAIRDQVPVERIVVMDDIETPGAAAWDRLGSPTLTGRSVQFEETARAIQPDDLATVIYTSGTTGIAKGVMLTHGNMATNIACSLEGFDIKRGQSSLSFLPLSHVTARHVDFAMLYHGVTLAYCPFIAMLPQTLLEVRPTFFVAVPRVYEKIYAQTQQKTKGFPKQAVYSWAVGIGRSHKPEILAGRTPASLSWQVANKLVFSKIRIGLGDRVETFVSGGAPLGRELAEWYATVGIRIHEGYGLTETSPVIAVNTPINHRIGTVGKTLSNLEVRIAEDGEILVRGPSVFQGYWNRPEETQNAFVDGWFKTGDIGNLDADGYLSVTDRKKDLIKTSGGKFIAPQPIENSLKLNPLVGTAAIVGDKRKFAAVILSPNFPQLEDWARTNHIPFASRAELVAHQKVQALYEQIVDGVNQNLARFETLKRVMLVADEFSADNGALTPTMKLRRRVIEDRYRQQIDNLYAQAESTSIS